MKKCPKCGKSYDDSWRICYDCQIPLLDGDVIVYEEGEKYFLFQILKKLISEDKVLLLVNKQFKGLKQAYIYSRCGLSLDYFEKAYWTEKVSLQVGSIGYRIMTPIPWQKALEDFVGDKNNQRQKTKEDAEGAVVDKYKGKENTEEVLKEKAKNLSQLIIVLSSMMTQMLIKGCKKDKKCKWEYAAERESEILETLSNETLFFFIHFIDRMAVEYLGQNKGRVFLDALIPNIVEDFSRINKKDAGETKDTFVAAYNNRQKEYSKYEMAKSDKDEGYHGVLIWEFGEKVSKIINGTPELNVISLVVKTFIDCSTELHLTALFTGEYARGEH